MGDFNRYIFSEKTYRNIRTYCKMHKWVGWVGFCTIRINATINSWKGLTPRIALLRLQSADSSKEHKTESPLKKK